MKAVTNHNALLARDPVDDAVRPAVAQKTVVVGLGNDLLSDDGVGLYIARRLRDRLDPRHFDILELSVGGLELVERMAGYRRAVLVDACRTGRRPVGTLTLHRPEEFVRSMRLACYHTVDFASAIELIRRLGGQPPEEIAVFAVEVEDVETIREGCTERVEASIEPTTEAIVRWLGGGEFESDPSDPSDKPKANGTRES